MPLINVGTNEENMVQPFVFFSSKLELEPELDLQTDSDSCQNVPAPAGFGSATLSVSESIVYSTYKVNYVDWALCKPCIKK